MIRFAASALFPSLLLTIIFVSTANAAVFTVNDTTDAVDANPGDGICATAAGTCSLRAAIMESSALGGDNTVLAGAGHFLLTLGALDLGRGLTLTGAGPDRTVIDGGGLGFDVLVAGGGITQVTGVTVTNGRNGISALGFDQVSISNCKVSGNTVGGVNGDVEASITISDSVIRDNGGVGVSASEAILDVLRTTISGNGEGILTTNVGLSISDSTISDNSPNGGISLGCSEFDPPAAAGSSAVTGEGVLMPPAIVNTTISGNYGTTGGGLNYENFCDPSASIIGPIVNTTITNNHATLGGGVYINTFDLCTAPVVGPSFSNSIVAGNSATQQGPDCFTEPSAPPPCTASSQLPSLGYNLIGDATSCNFLATTGDQVGTASNPINPGLGPLADNSGPTMTHALLPFISPAIDAGSPEVPGSSNTACELTDQRGITRPQDGDLDGDPAVCDIGAFELVPRADVAIEVEPFLPRDPIILSSPLPVTVAVLGSSTVDVTKIDLTTLQFGPNGATPLSTHTVPANGQVDLVALFKVQDIGLAVGDSQACLRAAIGGQPFLACDGVVVIMGRGCGLGFELALILPPLLWLRERRRRKLA